jgi:AraC-like DNA-binding protein
VKFEYLAREPAAPLRRFVSELWFARGTLPAARERIAPTGSAVLGIVLGDPIRQIPRNGAGEPHLADQGFLIGPDDHALVNEPTGGTWAVGIVATPVGCAPAFGVQPATIRGTVVDAARWPGFDVRGALTGADAASALDLVEAALLQHLGAPDPGLPRVEAAIEAIETDPGRPIAEVAHELGVSHGHLDREFARIVGLSPRTLARVIRLRALVASIDVYGGVEWTTLAAELGWFDQAHLIRDFRRFTGVAPREYAAAIRERYRPDEALPGFTPER